MEPLLQYVDAVTVPVPDLDRGMAFYLPRRTRSPVDLAERRGRASRTPNAPIKHGDRANQVASADAAAEAFGANGGKVLTEPVDIPIGRLASSQQFARVSRDSARM